MGGEQGGNNSGRLQRSTAAVAGRRKPAWDSKGTWDLTEHGQEILRRQIGLFKSLDMATNCADHNPDYAVFDSSGNLVYPDGLANTLT